MNSGCRIPKDLGLVHLNWSEDVSHWSGIRRNYELKAKVALEALVADMTKDRRFVAPMHSLHLVQPLWVEGDTLPKRKVTDKTLSWPEGFLDHLEPLDLYPAPRVR